MKEARRVCRECGKILTGRCDKKFCNDTCRSAYSNRKFRNENYPMIRINKILRKNHSILRYHIEINDLKPDLKELYHQGFDFDYFTSCCRLDRRHTLTYCFEICYIVHKDYLEFII